MAQSDNAESMKLQLRRAYREETGGATTYVHRLKCRHCRLEFAVFSWSAEWPHIRDWPAGARDPRPQERARPTCPGCGQTSDFLHQRSISEDPVYTLMQGEAVWMWGKGRRYAAQGRVRKVLPGELEEPLDDELRDPG